MKCVDVMMKSFKKDSGAIGVIASKVNSYFIIRLLIFDLQFNTLMLKTTSFFYLRMNRPPSKKY